MTFEELTEAGIVTVSGVSIGYNVLNDLINNVAIEGVNGIEIESADGREVYATIDLEGTPDSDDIKRISEALAYAGDELFINDPESVSVSAIDTTDVDGPDEPFVTLNLNIDAVCAFVSAKTGKNLTSAYILALDHVFFCESAIF